MMKRVKRQRKFESKAVQRKKMSGKYIRTIQIKVKN